MPNRRFRRIPTPRDPGNCFFQALRIAMTHLPSTRRRQAPSAAELRRRVARRMLCTASTPAQQAAAARAATGGAWAENEEVTAAAAEFGLRIRVWEGHNRMWVTFGDDDAAPLVYMQNASNLHFEAIEPL